MTRRTRAALSCIFALCACRPGDSLPRPTAGGVEDGTALGTVYPEEFRVLRRLDVGRNPHQIVFSSEGTTAYVAAAGSDQVTEVNRTTLQVVRTLSVPGAPIGVALLPGQDQLLVSRFAAGVIDRIDLADGETSASAEIGGAPSLIVGPDANGHYLVSEERGNRVWDVNGTQMALRFPIETGRRPFPPSSTPDGVTIYVPEYDDGTVSVYDLERDQITGTFPVGRHPSGGSILPDGFTYVVAVRGENRLAFINGPLGRMEGTVSDGIGEGPFSVVLAPNKRVGFVNNTGSDDVSLLSVEDRRIAARIPVGSIPIVMAVSPDGAQLWVSCEGSHDLWVLEIPARLR